MVAGHGIESGEGDWEGKGGVGGRKVRAGQLFDLLIPGACALNCHINHPWDNDVTLLTSPFAVLSPILHSFPGHTPLSSTLKLSLERRERRVGGEGSEWARERVAGGQAQGGWGLQALWSDYVITFLPDLIGDPPASPSLFPRRPVPRCLGARRERDVARSLQLNVNVQPPPSSLHATRSTPPAPRRSQLVARKTSATAAAESAKGYTSIYARTLVFCDVLTRAREITEMSMR